MKPVWIGSLFALFVISQIALGGMHWMTYRGQKVQLELLRKEVSALPGRVVRAFELTEEFNLREAEDQLVLRELRHYFENPGTPSPWDTPGTACYRQRIRKPVGFDQWKSIQEYKSVQGDSVELEDAK
ncbi:MAG: hypothetical protein L0Z55_03760 [Planctomycetes bacterium]|nr:hypothetical protein [Planctomycetota bacterium]